MRQRMFIHDTSAHAQLRAARLTFLVRGEKRIPPGMPLVHETASAPPPHLYYLHQG